ncbi:MAG: DNA mismatch repair protein MutS [Alphaproteobacteria bacterium]|nr:DNA mismatch repair protein MutS [Alphaproteobacteria bacterium]
MRKSKKRNLTEAERSLWSLATQHTERLKPTVPVLVQPKKSTQTRPLPTPMKMQPFRVGQLAKATAKLQKLHPDLDQQFAKTSPNMDKRNFERLKKGKLQVDGRIDLHGMTLAEAHPALNGFVRDAHADGKRLLLVITGKGGTVRPDIGGMPSRRGVLKSQVPQWLSMAPLSPLVLQVTQATQKHGGAGALYVYLRRQR